MRAVFHKSEVRVVLLKRPLGCRTDKDYAKHVPPFCVVDFLFGPTGDAYNAQHLVVRRCK